MNIMLLMMNIFLVLIVQVVQPNPIQYDPRLLRPLRSPPPPPLDNPSIDPLVSPPPPPAARFRDINYDICEKSCSLECRLPNQCSYRSPSRFIASPS